LTHVTDGETTERRVFSEGLDAHGLRGDEVDHGGVSRLDVLRGLFEFFSRTTIHLGNNFVELAGNVGSMAIQDRGITVLNLSGMVEDDDLGGEVSSLLWGIVFGITSDHSSSNILHRQVLDVEADVVSGLGFFEGGVMHFDGFNFSRDTSGGKGDDHSGLEDSGFDTTDGDCSDTGDFVDVLEGNSEGKVGGSLGRLNLVKSFEERGPLYQVMLGDFSSMLSPFQPEMGTKLTFSGLKPIFLIN
jgi:hypothetical protein